MDPWYSGILIKLLRVDKVSKGFISIVDFFFIPSLFRVGESLTVNFLYNCVSYFLDHVSSLHGRAASRLSFHATESLILTSGKDGMCKLFVSNI